jgi:hypothetical protein
MRCDQVRTPRGESLETSVVRHALTQGVRMGEKRPAPQIAWGQAPGPTYRGVPRRKIIRPTLNADVVGAIVSAQVEGVWVHFLSGHDWPCTGESKSCQGCQANPTSLRWKGYLELLAGGKVYLAEISEGAYQSCPRLGQLSDLRGCVIRIKRIDKRKNGRIVAELREEPRETALPAPREVRQLLQAIWFGRPKDADDLQPETEGEKDNEGTL